MCYYEKKGETTWKKVIIVNHVSEKSSIKVEGFFIFAYGQCQCCL